MRLHRLFSCLFVLMVWGCTPVIEDQPDGGGGSDPDASISRTGLVFVFDSEPGPDSQVGGGFSATLDEVELDLRDLRAIGDSAPGDERTSASAFDIEWEKDEPRTLRFSQAPPGFYSQLLAEVRSYEIKGTVEVEGEEQEFVIREEGVDIALTIALGNATLEPSMQLEIPVVVDVSAAVLAIDWSTVPAVPHDDEYELRVDSSWSDIGSIRGLIGGMFQAGEPTPVE